MVGYLQRKICTWKETKLYYEGEYEKQRLYNHYIGYGEHFGIKYVQREAKLQKL